MELISAEDRDIYFANFRREAVHLELLDFYSTSDLERDRFAAWKAGQTDDLAWMQEWCEEVRTGMEAGRSYRRACVVSEPLSDYRRFHHAVMRPAVEAGEDIRLVPRRLTSALALPGNDFWMFDQETVVFTVFSGEGDVVERQMSMDPDVIRLCVDAWTALWGLAIPHAEYRSS